MDKLEEIIINFIERGKGIYQTLFGNNKKDDTNLSNIIFKSINPTNNGNFKN